MIEISRRGALAMLTFCSTGVPRASAETFPNRVVRFVTPYSGGSGPDIVARLIAERLSRVFEKQVMVEPKPGASGILAMAELFKNSPNGYDLLFISNSHFAVNPLLTPNFPYSANDFSPVALIYRTPHFVVMPARGRFADFSALLAAATANPGSVSYGIPYFGSPSHIGVAMIEEAIGARMNRVFYKDVNQIFTSIATGDIDWALGTAATAGPMVAASKVNLVAVAAKERAITHPNVKTIAEVGGPSNIDVDTWIGVVAPRGTPLEIVNILNSAINQVMADAAFEERMKALGFIPSPGTPTEMNNLIQMDLLRYPAFVKKLGPAN